MKYISVPSIALFLLFGLSGRAPADVIFYFAESGQTTQVTSFSALPGGSLVVDIVASLSAGASMPEYGVSVQFNTLELNVVGATEDLPAGYTFNITDGVAGITEDIGDGVTGQVSTFEAATFGSGPTAPATFRIGSIEFTAINPSGTATDIDLRLGLFNDGIDSIGGAPGTVSFGNAAVVNSVPEPTALFILSLGSVVAVLRRRRSS